MTASTTRGAPGAPDAPPAAPTPGSGLTTTKSAFIENARAAGKIYIHQPYELYSSENHDTWGLLLDRMRPGSATPTPSSSTASTTSASPAPASPASRK